MLNVNFEYYIHIKFNLNYSTCFHNILEGALCKDILTTCNITTIFNTKTWKTKLSLHLLWLGLQPKCFNSYLSFYLLV